MCECDNHYIWFFIYKPTNVRPHTLWLHAKRGAVTRERSWMDEWMRDRETRRLILTTICINDFWRRISSVHRMNFIYIKWPHVRLNWIPSVEAPNEQQRTKKINMNKIIQITQPNSKPFKQTSRVEGNVQWNKNWWLDFLLLLLPIGAGWRV